MSFYRTGTLALTNGSTSVVGTGTDFISGAAIGECVQAPDGKLYEIASIQSATALTLGSVYLGATASGQTYSIVPTQSYIRDLASQAATLVNGYSATQANALTLTATDKTSIVDADKLGGRDSVTGLARLFTWSGIKTAIAALINGGTLPGSFTTVGASGNTNVLSLKAANDAGSTLISYKNSAGADLWTIGNGIAISQDEISISKVGVGTIGRFSPTGLAVTGTLTTNSIKEDAAGNLGLGVVPSANANPLAKALQIKNYSTFMENQGGATEVGFNCIESGNGIYKYLQPEYATRYRQVSGAHTWYTAPSGTAGQPITFTQAMTLDVNSQLSVAAGLSVHGVSNLNKGAGAYLDYAGGSARLTALNPGVAWLPMFTQAISHQWSLSGGTAAMTLDADSNLEILGKLTSRGNTHTIGSTTPSQTTSVDFRAYRDTGTSSHVGSYVRSVATLFGGICDATQLEFGTSNPAETVWDATTKMTLDAGGNLLVGGTTLSLSNASNVLIQPSAGALIQQHVSGTSSGDPYTLFVYEGTVIGSITQSGTTSVEYYKTSDHRLKTNVRTANAARFMDIEFVDFEWVDGRHDCGVIADQLQSVYPDLVMGEKDATEVRTVEITPAVPAVTEQRMVQEAQLQKTDGEGNVITPAAEAVYETVEITPAIPAVTEDQTFPVYQQVNYMGLIGRMGTRVQSLQRTVDAQAALLESVLARLTALEAA